MRATFACFAAALVAAVSAAPAFAQVVWCAPALHRPLGVAPDACGPGFTLTDVQGTTFGPNYYLRPPFPPEQGIGPGAYLYCYMTPYGPVYQRGLPPPQALPQLPPQALPHAGPQAPLHAGPLARFFRPTAAFPTHPYARSPRDFFMWGEAAEDEISRLRHPALIP